jgi:hypothetical protein
MGCKAYADAAEEYTEINNYVLLIYNYFEQIQLF